jgi:hypothetical protein
VKLQLTEKIAYHKVEEVLATIPAHHIVEHKPYHSIDMVSSYKNSQLYAIEFD